MHLLLRQGFGNFAPLNFDPAQNSHTFNPNPRFYLSVVLYQLFYTSPAFRRPSRTHARTTHAFEDGVNIHEPTALREEKQQRYFETLVLLSCFAMNFALIAQDAAAPNQAPSLRGP